MIQKSTSDSFSISGAKKRNGTKKYKSMTRSLSEIKLLKMMKQRPLGGSRHSTAQAQTVKDYLVPPQTVPEDLLKTGRKSPKIV